MFQRFENELTTIKVFIDQIERKYLERSHVYLTEMFKKLRVRTESRHATLHDQLSETLTATRVTDNKQRNVQLYTHHL
jgi:hypothetical protein